MTSLRAQPSVSVVTFSWSDIAENGHCAVASCGGYEKVSIMVETRGLQECAWIDCRVVSASTWGSHAQGM